jgi:polyketide biosynthesis enoyl-CoA hydratase PksH
MEQRAVRVEVAGELLRLTLDRPERRNTIDAAMLEQLQAALDQAERDPDCRVVLLEGRDGVFCTGMDMVEGARNGAAHDSAGDAFFALLRRFTTIPRIVVAGVDGRVIGGGVGLAAACDLVYATERSTFGLPEALWGLLPCVVLPFLARRTGFQKAYSMTLSTQAVDAKEAKRFHLVDEVADRLDAPMRRLAYRAAKLDGSVIGSLKRYAGELWPISDGVQRSAVGELGRLLSSPSVRARLADFATHGRLPWE